MQAKDIKRLLILDTETTGLDPAADNTIEIACSLYSIEHTAPVASFASLIYAVRNEAEHINQISVRLLAEAPNQHEVWPIVEGLAQQADVIVAHRAEFDVQFVPYLIQKLKPWACSKNDMDWPRGRAERGDGLVHLALAHGVAVVSAHRAMVDVDTLVRTFQAAQKMGHDVALMVARSLRPKAKFIASVSFAEKDKAKEKGFEWDDKKKIWTRVMFLDEAAKLPFKVKRVVETAA
jgi:DNA polymerase-3 subunit epsilon